MNRFQHEFLEKFADLCKEYNMLITDDGHLDSLEDWVDIRKKFQFIWEKDEYGIKITGVENI